MNTLIQPLSLPVSRITPTSPDSARSVFSPLSDNIAQGLAGDTGGRPGVRNPGLVQGIGREDTWRDGLRSGFS